ncbi:MAG: HU family DNA-binding protein [Candidatus Cloacimonetes bacterium]|nr:HU family DNA-binding protein [Candidatus Cloacimonadota bacterium]
MTKDQIIKYIAENAEISQANAKVALNALLEAITDTLKKKDKVVFTGFGTFSVAQRKARKGKNPSNGQVINIPAKTVPVFKAGKTLKESL